MLACYSQCHDKRINKELWSEYKREPSVFIFQIVDFMKSEISGVLSLFAVKQVPSLISLKGVRQSLQTAETALPGRLPVWSRPLKIKGPWNSPKHNIIADYTRITGSMYVPEGRRKMNRRNLNRSLGSIAKDIP